MTQIDDYAEQGYRPGMLGRCAQLMARFYCRKFGFDASFEVGAARELAAFIAGFDPARDGFWLVRRGGEIVGCAAVDGRGSPDGAADSALFRWFYLGAAARGRGLGRTLLERALGHCRRAGYAQVRLHTHEELHAAVHLYERFGFRRTGHDEGMYHGRPLRLTRFALELPRPA